MCVARHRPGPWIVAFAVLSCVGSAAAQTPVPVHVSAPDAAWERLQNQLNDLPVVLRRNASSAQLTVTLTPSDDALALEMRDTRWAPTVFEEVAVVPASADVDGSALYETAALRVRAFVRTALTRAEPTAGAVPSPAAQARPSPPPPPPVSPTVLTAGVGWRLAVDSESPAHGPSVRLGLRFGPLSVALRLLGGLPQTWSIVGAQIQRQRFEAVAEGGFDADPFDVWVVGGRVWVGAVFELRQTLAGPNPTPATLHGILSLGAGPRLALRFGPVEVGLCVGVDVWPWRPSYRVAGQPASEPWPVQPTAELSLTLAATP